MNENVIIAIKNFTEVCSLGSNKQYSNIVWTDDGLFADKYASLGLNE